MVEFPACCYRFIPEFTLESTWIIFFIKLALVIVLAGCLFVFEAYLDERVFDTGSSITFATVLVVVIFNITVAFLIVIYLPYMWHISPFWYSLLLTVLYVGSLIYFTLESLIFDNIANVDDPAFDGWTIVHTLAGFWLGFLLPFVPMCYVVSVWEVLEADWTEGLGDGESLSNHITDVIVAVVGWFITVLLSMYLFPKFECKQTTLNCLGKRNEDKKDQCLIKWVQSFHRVPWISARAASCNKCYWDHDWESNDNENAGKSANDAERGQTQMTGLR